LRPPEPGYNQLRQLSLLDSQLILLMMRRSQLTQPGQPETLLHQKTQLAKIQP
jgi:hypothetical protein